MVKGKVVGQVMKKERRVLKQMLRDHDKATRESKYQTTIQSGTTSSSGTSLEITQYIGQGDNVNMRSGDSISVTELDVWFQASMNSAASVDRVRLIILIDKLNLGASTALTDVLDTASVLSAYNTYAVQTGRFKILLDETIPMSINGSSRAINVRRKFKLHELKVTYITTTGSWGKNSIKAFVMDDLGANNATYAFSHGLHYYDA